MLVNQVFSRVQSQPHSLSPNPDSPSSENSTEAKPISLIPLHRKLDNLSSSNSSANAGQNNQTIVVPIIPAPPMETPSSGSPLDLLLLLSISLLFIIFFILWIRAYHGEMERRRLEKIRRWQLLIYQQRLAHLQNSEDENFWKRTNFECLPLYSEHDELVDFPHVHVTNSAHDSIGVNVLNRVEVESHHGRDGNQTDLVSESIEMNEIRIPPPAYYL